MIFFFTFYANCPSHKRPLLGLSRGGLDDHIWTVQASFDMENLLFITWQSEYLTHATRASVPMFPVFYYNDTVKFLY